MATVAAIVFVADWHLLAFLPLLPAFPPAVFVFLIVWAFAGWVWPAGGAPPAPVTDGVQPCSP